MTNFTKSNRVFSNNEIETIQLIVKEKFNTSRCIISREVCEKLNWFSENGKPKAWICREFLCELEKNNIIKLPLPKKSSLNRFKKKQYENIFQEPINILKGKLNNFPKPMIKRVLIKQENDLWDYFNKKYHYLGYKGQVGRFLKYLVYIDNLPVACVGWTGAALKVASRDKYLNWDEKTKQIKLKNIANNFRFLILPWVQIKYLASHILSKNIKILLADWKKEYNVEIHYLETFVEKNRFLGTCYKAANWIKVGETKGFSRAKIGYQKHNIIKDVYIYKINKGLK